MYELYGKKQPEIDPSADIRQSEIGKSIVRPFAVLYLVEMGDGCRIFERVSLKGVTLGNDCDINVGTYIENATIGNNVLVGPNCSIVGVTHDITGEQVERKPSYEKVMIGNGVFIGAGCVLLTGVKIGDGSVIGAGTIVSKDIPHRHICFNNTVKSLQEHLLG